MFSGIVEEIAAVVAFRRLPQGGLLTVESGLDHSDAKVGDSIAIDGVCLTLVEKAGRRLSFDVSEESLRRSTLKKASAGRQVNLERSLRLGDRIHGHLVYGHVDAVITLQSRRGEGEGLRLEWSLPSELRRFVVQKGSVAIAGVSLTVGELKQNSFSVYTVPHTLAVTTLDKMGIGDEANIEVDMLGRYVESMLGKGQSREGSVTLEFLREHGYAGSEDE